MRAAAGRRRPGHAVPDAGGFRRLAGLILEDTIAAEARVRIALVGRNAAVDGVWSGEVFVGRKLLPRR